MCVTNVCLSPVLGLHTFGLQQAWVSATPCSGVPAEHVHGGSGCGWPWLLVPDNRLCSILSSTTWSWQKRCQGAAKTPCECGSQ
eukprot:11885875-Prorocentrum_lima.AAC.1